MAVDAGARGWLRIPVAPGRRATGLGRVDLRSGSWLSASRADAGSFLRRVCIVSLVFALGAAVWQGPWSFATQLALVIGVHLLPWVLPGRLRATSGFDVLAFVGAIDLIYFGGGALYMWLSPEGYRSVYVWGHPWDTSTIGPSALSWALFWVSAGWACCMAGFGLCPHVFSRIPERKGGEIPVDWQLIVPSLIVLGLFCKLLVPVASGTYIAVVGIYSQLCPVGLGFAAYRFAKARRPDASPWAWLVAIALPTWVLLSLPDAQREPVLLPFLYVAIGYRLGAGRPYRRFLVVMGIAVCVLSLEYLGDYKTVRRRGETIVGSIAYAAKVVADSGVARYVGRSLDVAGRRLNHLEVFSVVIWNTPEPNPFLHGQTYALSLWTAIPRFVYPDKPTLSVYNNFAHAYGLVTREDYSTAIGMLPIVEMYINFGYTGIVIGMLLYGALLRMLFAWVTRQARVPGLPVMLYIPVLYAIARQDILAMTMANVLKLALGIVLFVRVVGRVGEGTGGKLHRHAEV